jgi:hypothetical protein
MAGCRSLSAISRYGHIHTEVMAPLGLRRSPSVATVHRLLRRVAVAPVRAALAVFTRPLVAARTGHPEVGVVAVDGKTLRGVWEGGAQLHMLHVFAQRSVLGLDRVAVGCALDETVGAQDWLATGEVSERVRSLVTSLDAEQADPPRVLALSRSHWGSENRLFPVADDAFGEDRHVLQSHPAGAVLSLRRTTALNLLRAECRLWTTKTPLTARAEWVNGYPSAVLTALEGLCKGPGAAGGQPVDGAGHSIERPILHSAPPRQRAIPVARRCARRPPRGPSLSR